MLQPTWNPFSKYADNFEKKVDKFLRKQNIGNMFGAQKELLELMQKNLVILNLWLEYKFKGYKYLRKGKRKVFYHNAENIAERFLQFCQENPISESALRNIVARAGLLSDVAALLPANIEKLKYLAQIMLFLAPGKYYQYLEGASFGKLLTNLEHEKMIGDCNQIVTFYTYLYSLKFNLTDLEIKLPPQHICLHFCGLDVEATNGTFTLYRDTEEVFGIAELISTNLLDVSDFRDKQLKIDSKEFLKGSKLAYNISSNRELVDKNLKISFHNVGVEEMKLGNFDSAALYFGMAGDYEAVQSAHHNAAIAEVDKLNFERARYYADKAQEPKLGDYVTEKEAFYYYKQGSFEHARELFARVSNEEMVKACYAGEYNQIQARVRGLNDLETMKSHKYDYQKMLDLAYKMEDQNLISNLQDVLRQL